MLPFIIAIFPSTVLDQIVKEQVFRRGDGAYNLICSDLYLKLANLRLYFETLTNDLNH
jgi:hypothetical protein